jgi:hypothetical protein
VEQVAGDRRGRPRARAHLQLQLLPQHQPQPQPQPRLRPRLRPQPRLRPRRQPLRALALHRLLRIAPPPEVPAEAARRLCREELPRSHRPSRPARPVVAGSAVLPAAGPSSNRSRASAAASAVPDRSAAAWSAAEQAAGRFVPGAAVHRRAEAHLARARAAAVAAAAAVAVAAVAPVRRPGRLPGD